MEGAGDGIGRGPGGRGALAARLCGAALLLGSGAIHLDLFLTSYRHVPTIGPLFLAQSAAAFLLGLAVASSPSPWPSLAGALLALSTLGGYVLSLAVRLFGFHEVRTAAGIAAAVVEVAAAAVLGTVAASAAGPGGRLGARLVSPVVGAAMLAVSLALALASLPAGTGGTTVEAARLPRFGAVLATSKGASLYLLSSEGHGRVACTGGCLSIWPPLLAAPGRRPVAAGGALSGRLGLLARSAGRDQVTYNGYPLYTYVGDARPGLATGEGIVSFGGTWYLLRASATRPAATAVR